MCDEVLANQETRHWSSQYRYFIINLHNLSIWVVRNAPEPENERQRISTCSTPGGRPCRGHDKEIDTDLKWGIVSIPRNTTAGFREKYFYYDWGNYHKTWKKQRRNTACLTVIDTHIHNVRIPIHRLDVHVKIISLIQAGPGLRLRASRTLEDRSSLVTGFGSRNLSYG